MIEDKPMNKKKAAQLAQEIWGPTARVFRHNDPIDRFSRFSIQFIEPGGLTDSPKLHIFATGSNFDECFAGAAINPVSQYFAKWWEDTKNEYSQFANDPREYFRQIMKAKFGFDPAEVEQNTEKETES